MQPVFLALQASPCTMYNVVTNYIFSFKVSIIASCVLAAFSTNRESCKHTRGLTKVGESHS